MVQTNEDARSLEFAEASYSIANVDCFALDTTRLRPHIEAMRVNVADALGIDLAGVSVKAGSNDGIGPEGEGATCAAWANALVCPTNA